MLTSHRPPTSVDGHRYRLRQNESPPREPTRLGGWQIWRDLQLNSRDPTYVIAIRGASTTGRFTRYTHTRKVVQGVWRETRGISDGGALGGPDKRRVHSCPSLGGVFGGPPWLWSYLPLASRFFYITYPSLRTSSATMILHKVNDSFLDSGLTLSRHGTLRSINATFASPARLTTMTRLTTLTK